MDEANVRKSINVNLTIWLEFLPLLNRNTWAELPQLKSVPKPVGLR